MKTKSFLFSLMLVAGVIGFSSCEKDDPSPLTKEEADLQVSSASTDYDQIENEFNTSTGNLAYDALIDLDVPFILFEGEDVAEDVKASNIYDKALSLKYFKTTKSIKSEFDFESNAGTWTWTAAGWEHNALPANKIIINFPYKSTTNNANLTYSDYTFKNITSNGYTFKMVTGLKGVLTYNNATVWSFTFSNNFTGFENFKVSMNYTIGKFNMVVESTLITTENTINSISKIVFKKDGSVVYKNEYNSSYTISLTTGGKVLITANLTIKSIEFRYSLAYTGNVDIWTNPNDYLKISVYNTNGAKIGDFKYKKVDSYWKLYFYYANGQEEETTTFLKGLYEEFDGLLYDFI